MAICMTTAEVATPQTDDILHYRPHGVRIATPRGEKPLEALQPDDRVITRDNGLQKIRWIGRRRLSGEDLQCAPHLWPFLIRAGALGEGLPERDMLVSPQHRLLLSGGCEGLVAVRRLTMMQGIYQTKSPDTTFIHFMCERHEMVLLNGIWMESFQPKERMPDITGAAQRDEICELFPELSLQGGVGTCQTANHELPRQGQPSLMR